MDTAAPIICAASGPDAGQAPVQIEPLLRGDDQAARAAAMAHLAQLPERYILQTVYDPELTLLAGIWPAQAPATVTAIEHIIDGPLAITRLEAH